MDVGVVVSSYLKEETIQPTLGLRSYSSKARNLNKNRRGHRSYHFLAGGHECAGSSAERVVAHNASGSKCWGV